MVTSLELDPIVIEGGGLRVASGDGCDEVAVVCVCVYGQGRL